MGVFDRIYFVGNVCIFYNVYFSIYKKEFILCCYDFDFIYYDYFNC